MKIQADIPEDMNKKLKIVKVLNDFNDLQETMIAILEKFFDEYDFQNYKIKWKESGEIE